jgi:hypothetical protein
MNARSSSPISCVENMPQMVGKGNGMNMNLVDSQALIVYCYITLSDTTTQGMSDHGTTRCLVGRQQGCRSTIINHCGKKPGEFLPNLGWETIKKGSRVINQQNKSWMSQQVFKSQQRPNNNG